MLGLELVWLGPKYQPNTNTADDSIGPGLGWAGKTQIQPDCDGNGPGPISLIPVTLYFLKIIKQISIDLDLSL